MQAIPKTFTVTKKKNSIYSFISFFVISDDHSKISQYFYLCISEIQYIAILLWMQYAFLSSADSNPATQLIHKIAESIAFEFIWENGIQTSIISTLLTASWIYIALFSGMISYLAFKAHRGEQSIHKWATKSIFIGSQLHFGFIFWIINMISMISLSSRMLASDSSTLYSNQNISFVAGEIFIIILNYGIGVITAIFCFDPFCSNNSLASQNSLFQFLNFFFKAIVAPIAIFGRSDAIFVESAFVIIGFAISVSRLAYLIKTFPFYYHRAMQIALIFSGITSWISFINILALIWQSAGVIIAFSPMFLMIIPLPLVIKLLLGRLKSLIEHYASLDPYSLNTRREIFKKLFACQLLTEKVNLSLNENISFNRSEIYFLGDLHVHSKTCEDQQCLCTLLIKNQSKKNTVNFCVTKSSLLSYFHTMNYAWLTEAIKKIKDSNDLKILLAYLLFLEPSNKLSGALAYIFSTPDDSLDFFMITKKNILVQKIQNRIFNYFNNNSDGKTLNIAKFVDYYCDTTDFAAQIISNTEKFIAFWEEYRKIDIKMVEMVKRSEEIEDDADKIDRLWNNYVEKYEPFYHIMKDSYRMYLILVRNAPFTSRKRIKKYHWKKGLRDFDSSAMEEILEEDLILSKTINFYISMNKDKIGRILYASDNINSLLGYNQKDTIGKNINSLMPTLYAEQHDNFLYRHLDRSKTTNSRDYYIIAGYTKTKAGYIIPCSVHVSIFPYIQKELVYFGTVKVLNSNCDHILIDSTGIIDSYTEELGYKLNLNAHKRHHLKDICMNVDKISSHFDAVFMSRTYSIDMTDNLRKEKSLKNASRVFPDQNEDYTEEIIENSIVLIFIMQGDNPKLSKYEVKLIRKTLMNKKFFILIMDDKFYSVKDDKSRKESIEVDESIETISEDEDSSLEVAQEKTLIGETSAEEFDDTYNRTNMSKFNFLKTNASRRKSVIVKKQKGYKSDSSENTFELKKDTNPSQPQQQARPKYETRNKLMRFDSKSESYMNMDRKFTRNLRKQNQVLSTTMRNKFLEMQSDRGSTTSAHNVHRKIEQAIYSLPSSKSAQLLKIAMFGFLIMCGVLLIIFLYKTQDNLQLVKGSLSVLTSSNLRLFEIADLNKRARALSLFFSGIFNDYRYYVFRLYSVPGTALVLLKTIQQDFNKYNNRVRIALDQVDPTLRMQFYTNLINVTVVDYETTTQLTNTFDLAAMLIVRTQRLTKYLLVNPYAITLDNFDLNFILKNTLNKFLLSSEQITTIILDDNDVKLDSWKNLVIYFIAVCCFIGLIQFFIFVYNQRASVRSRDKFIELFLRLSPEEVNQNINHVKAFKNELSKNRLKFKHRELEDFFVETNQIIYKDKSKAGFKSRKRVANLENINKAIYKVLCLALLLFVLGLLPFMYISAIVAAKKNLIKEEITMVVQVNTNLYDLNLISTAIYEYVQFDGTTQVRTRPIGEEWEATYERLATAQQFFGTLFDSGKITDETVNADLKWLLTGNLCDYLKLSAVACSLGQGRFEQGIIGMNSFVLLTLRTIKSSYDASDHSMLSKQAALNYADLVSLEYIYYLTQMPAYEKLGQILETRVEAHIQEVEDLLKLPVVLSIVIYIVFGLILSHYLWKNVDEERIKWKKMFRKIPFTIIVTNKAFKNYLVKEYSNILDSVKRHI